MARRKHKKIVHQKPRKKVQPQSKKKRLRSGSKEVKRQLLIESPHCDMCDCKSNLQLHHVYLIRHGFQTQKEHCVLLCPHHHKEFHERFDNYLDRLFNENPDTDFMEVYEKLKAQMLKKN